MAQSEAWGRSAHSHATLFSWLYASLCSFHPVFAHSSPGCMLRFVRSFHPVFVSFFFTSTASPATRGLFWQHRDTQGTIRHEL